ncbi:hypothetical protein ES705_42814 [subsurface metagenome]
MLFEAENVVKNFGGLKAVDNVSFSVEEGGDIRSHRSERCRKNDIFKLCSRGNETERGHCNTVR